jgi:acetylornithine deacetylase/succinyl-diaminopimelate desuccinylase-like protein
MLTLRHLVLLPLTLASLAAFAAPGDPAALAQEPAIKAALDAVKANEPETVELQIKLNEIPAPPFMEQKRAAELKRLFEDLGLKNVFIDQEGNVLGTRPGKAAKPHVVLSAHLDTVFPEGTDVTVKRDGKILRAPGIGDDTRGLAELVSVIRALKEAKVETPGTITFVASVGEEGLGDLRGVKAIFNTTLKDQVDYYVAIDGGLPTNITHIAVGSYRYLVTFKGPGGHSYGAFGLPNPIHALSRAGGKIADIKVPVSPKTTFNIGRIGGGTSVNSIPFEAWMEIDMRSADVPALNTVRDQIVAAINEAVTEENARWKSKSAVTVDIKFVGDRPAGQTPPDSVIVKTAQATIRALGGLPTLSTGSTDSNYPIRLGIPAVTMGRGGNGTGNHSLDESFDTTDAWKGPQHDLLLTIALAQ